MKTVPRIAVVGSANVDLTTFTARMPRAGETLFAQSFDLGFGGKGANQAVAARLCGAEVALVARVGDDLFGPATLEHLEGLGIDVSWVRTVPGVSSGVAPIFVDSTGENRILVVKGANDRLTPKDVDEAAPLLSRADCLVLQLEVPLQTVYRAIRFASEHGIRCILNPAPGQPLAMDRVGAVDYFIPNETEAEAIAGLKVETLEEAEQCAQALLSHGLRRVIITLGQRGALLAEKGQTDFVPAFAVQAHDTTGAGDAFVGSFAVFLAEGLPEREALARASLYAALSTTRTGTQKSFPDREELEKEWRIRGGERGE